MQDTGLQHILMHLNMYASVHDLNTAYNTHQMEYTCNDGQVSGIEYNPRGYSC